MTKDIDFYVKEPYSISEPEVRIYRKTAPDARAEFACELMKHFGLVVGEPDGEDTVGRQQLRKSTPKEVVERAVNIAKLAFVEFERHGWLLHLPDLKELVAKRLEDKPSTKVNRDIDEDEDGE